MRRVGRRSAVLIAVSALAVTFGATAPSFASGVSGDGAPAASTARGSMGPDLTWRAVLERVDRAGGRAPAVPAAPIGAPVRAAAGAASAKSISAVPSTGLASGQVVAVEGTGFAGSATVVIVECRAGATGPEGCELFGIGIAQADAAGAFSTIFAVHRLVHADTGTIDCASAPGACVLAVADIVSIGLDAQAALTFDPTQPVPSPTLTVVPATGLLDGDVMTVTGDGFDANAPLGVGECISSSPFCFGSGGDIFTDAAGHFSTSVTARLRVTDELGQLTTCLAVDCKVRAFSFANSDYAADVPITFDPGQPLPPPPVVTVTPATGLHHLQTVQVHGTGFDAGQFVEIGECGPDGSIFCEEFVGSADVDASGTFTTDVAVTRLVTAFGPTGVDIVDCADGGCSLDASEFVEGSGSFSVGAPIAFDGSVPPPAVPTMTVNPSTDLPYRTQVTALGHGFGPGEEVEASFCIESEVEGSCNGVSATADASGNVTVPVAVQRIVRNYDGSTTDCVDPTVQCSVQMSGRFGFEQTRADVSFDPSAPVPPPPLATATPDRGLGYRQTVTLAGANFLPGPVFVTECTREPGAPFGFADCAGFGTATAAADGTLSGSFVASKILTSGFGPPTDCSTAFGTCFLRIGEGGEFGLGDFVDVPLGFDPASQPPPPPPVTVSPHTHLHDGQTVSVAGSGFAPNAGIGIAECKAGVQSFQDCDTTHTTLAFADGQGSFRTTATVVAQLQTSNGPVDCTAAAGACVLGVANTADYLEYSLTPLSFDAPELEVHGVSVPEGTGGVTPAPVRVELSDPAPAAIPVHWQAVPGTAGAQDFTATGGTVTIPAGATAATIPAEVVADALDEPTERFTVRVTSAPGARVTDADATVKIRDDDAAPTVVVHDARRREDHGEAHAEVLLSAPSGRTVIVHYVTHHGSARAGSDYVRKDSRLIFLPGQVRHVVRVVLVDDGVHEPTETFRVELDRIEEATASRDTAMVTITDDD